MEYFWNHKASKGNPTVPDGKDLRGIGDHDVDKDINFVRDAIKAIAQGLEDGKTVDKLVEGTRISNKTGTNSQIGNNHQIEISKGGLSKDGFIKGLRANFLNCLHHLHN